jgi:hypothetical protein
VSSVKVTDVVPRSGGAQKDDEIKFPTKIQVLSKIPEGQICMDYGSTLPHASGIDITL